MALPPHFLSNFPGRANGSDLAQRARYAGKTSRDCAEACIWYVAQAIPQIDVEIAKKGPFLGGNWLTV
jgi:hypothetical protein